MKLSSAVSLLILFSVSLVAAAAQTAPALPNTDSSAAQHGSADALRLQAQEFIKLQAEEDALAAHYARNFGSTTKLPNPYDSATRLSAYYGYKAKQLLARADAIDKPASH